MEKLGVSISLTSGYHLQSHGQMQRANQETEWFLRCFCLENPANWAQFLPWAESAPNSLRHSSICLTLFRCVLGYQPPLFPWNTNITNSPVMEKWFRQSEQMWENTHQRLEHVACLQIATEGRPHSTTLATEYGWPQRTTEIHRGAKNWIPGISTPTRSCRESMRWPTSWIYLATATSPQLSMRILSLLSLGHWSPPCPQLHLLHL